MPHLAVPPDGLLAAADLKVLAQALFPAPGVWQRGGGGARSLQDPRAKPGAGLVVRAPWMLAHRTKFSERWTSAAHQGLRVVYPES